MQALVYWTDFNLTDLVPISHVPVQSRNVGRIDEVLYTDGKRYMAQVLKIASKSVKDAALVYSY